MTVYRLLPGRKSPTTNYNSDGSGRRAAAAVGPVNTETKECGLGTTRFTAHVGSDNNSFFSLGDRHGTQLHAMEPARPSLSSEPVVPRRSKTATAQKLIVYIWEVCALPIWLSHLVHRTMQLGSYIVWWF